MKYGQNFTRESVPEWSLHNIDYNALKHFIKVHTTKDEAKAIAIPGQPDTHLAKVEDDLYHELCAQHDAAALFVTAKADEISRRLRTQFPPSFAPQVAPRNPANPFASGHLSNEIHRLVLRCANADPSTLTRKRQRRFLRLEREAVECGRDVQHLQRFVNAQAIAFSKILKKYRVCQPANPVCT